MANMAGRGSATQDVRGPAASGADRGRGYAAHDLPIIGAGILALISSFLPWFGATYHSYTYGTVRTWHDSSNAWYSGALAWIPIVLMLLAAGIATAYLLSRGRMPGLGGIGPSTAIAALSALSLLLIAVRWISLPHLNVDYDGAVTVSSGARVGLILGFIASIIMTVFAARRLKASGERLPGGYSRDASLAGYGGGDRARALDRERQYAGRENEPGQGQRYAGPGSGPGQGQYTGREDEPYPRHGTAAPGAERRYPDERGGPAVDPNRAGPDEAGERLDDRERRWDR